MKLAVMAGKKGLKEFWEKDRGIFFISLIGGIVSPFLVCAFFEQVDTAYFIQ
jgi:hypothetical protein